MDNAKVLRLGIVGSRKRNSTEDFNAVLNAVKELKPSLIISGGCSKGADNFAEIIAKQENIPIKIFYPKFESKAYSDLVKGYYARNKLIAENSDKLIALVCPERKGGTENTIGYMEELGKEVILK